MNKIISTFALISIALTSSAQQFTARDEATTTKSVTNISILSPAITHEIAIGRKQSVFFAGELSLISRYESVPLSETKSYYGFVPKLSVDFRNYYNFERRLSKGKNITHNSGNFLALRTQYIFDPIIGKEDFLNYNNGITLGGVWGIQRVYSSGIYLGLSLGVGALFGDVKLDAIGMGDFHLGFNIGSSNKK